MEKVKVIIDVEQNREEGYTRFDLIFSETGEIRRKQISDDFLMRRIFMNELKTWRNKGEELIYDPTMPKPDSRRVTTKWRGKIDKED